MIIIFGWDGTIAKPDVAREAAHRRFLTLGKTVSEDWLKEAMKKNDHYAVNKELIKEYTGISDDRELTIIMTDIFRFHYVAVVKEWQEKCLYPGMADVIKTLTKNGHTLIIASTLRQDLLEYSLQNLGLRGYFKAIYANTPDLRFEKLDLVQEALKHHGEIAYVIGDKEEDYNAGKFVGAKTIYVTWGATQDTLKGNADVDVKTADEILKSIN